MRISINRLWSSHGRGGLEGDRPSSSFDQHFLAEVRQSASALTAHRRSRNFPLRYRSRPSGEVWRATGPPAPASIIPAQKFSLSSPFPTAHRRSRNFPPRYRLAHPRRSGGRPALLTSRPAFPHAAPLPRPYPAGVCQSDTVQIF